MTTILINTLKQMAIENSEQLLSNEDIRKINVTDIFWAELDQILEKELLNMQFVGEPTIGKSSCAFKVVKRGNKKLGKRMHIGRIKADQSEFSEYIRTSPHKEGDDSPHKAVTMIDEWSEIATTGSGATTEESYLNWLSDVSAQEYYHRVSCSPSTIVDKRANIIIEIIGKDTDKKINRGLVSYRIIKPEGEYTQLVGYMDFFVGDVLEELFAIFDSHLL